MPVRDACEERVQAQIESHYEPMGLHEAPLESTEPTSMGAHLEALRQLKEKCHRSSLKEVVHPNS